MDAERAFFALPPEVRRPETARELRAVVRSSRVVPGLRQVTASALRTALHHLELPEARIVWVVQLRHALPGERSIDTPRGRYAWTSPVDRPTTIYLSPWVPDPVRTVLHEARHLWQGHQGWFDPSACQDPECTEHTRLTGEEEDRAELDATVWAADTMRELRLVEWPRCASRGLDR